MMYCEQCGHSIHKDDTFCSNCGKRNVIELETFCAECNTKLAKDANFCSNCGAKVVVDIVKKDTRNVIANVESHKTQNAIFSMLFGAPTYLLLDNQLFYITDSKILRSYNFNTKKITNILQNCESTWSSKLVKSGHYLYCIQSEGQNRNKIIRVNVKDKKLKALFTSNKDIKLIAANEKYLLFLEESHFLCINLSNNKTIALPEINEFSPGEEVGNEGFHSVWGLSNDKIIYNYFLLAHLGKKNADRIYDIANDKLSTFFEYFKQPINTSYTYCFDDNLEKKYVFDGKYPIIDRIGAWSQNQYVGRPIYKLEERDIATDKVLNSWKVPESYSTFANSKGIFNGEFVFIAYAETENHVNIVKINSQSKEEVIFTQTFEGKEVVLISLAYDDGKILLDLRLKQNDHYENILYILECDGKNQIKINNWHKR